MVIIKSAMMLPIAQPTNALLMGDRINFFIMCSKLLKDYAIYWESIACKHGAAEWGGIEIPYQFLI